MKTVLLISIVMLPACVSQEAIDQCVKTTGYSAERCEVEIMR